VYQQVGSEEQAMADSVHQQAGLQHLAHLRQEDSVPQAVLVHQHQHQVALAEAGLEAHLQHLQSQQVAENWDQHQQGASALHYKEK
jgi:hypothetical protein